MGFHSENVPLMNTCLPPPSHLKTVGNILFSVSLSDMERGMPSTKSSSLQIENIKKKKNYNNQDKSVQTMGVRVVLHGQTTNILLGRIFREHRIGFVQGVGIRILIENERLTLHFFRRRRRNDQACRFVPLITAGVAHNRITMGRRYGDQL